MEDKGKGSRPEKKREGVSGEQINPTVLSVTDVLMSTNKRKKKKEKKNSESNHITLHYTKTKYLSYYGFINIAFESLFHD